jgi:hypothetical protein
MRPVVQRLFFCAAPLSTQQWTCRIIRSDGGQKQIAETREMNAKSVPNPKANPNRWPTRVECREKPGFNPERPPPQPGQCRPRGRTSGMCGLKRLSAWQFVETDRVTPSHRL